MPYYLEDGQTACLVNPGSVDELVAALTRLFHDAPLRQRLIKQGYQLARENTLEVRAVEMVSGLKMAGIKCGQVRQC